MESAHRAMALKDRPTIPLSPALRRDLLDHAELVKERWRFSMAKRDKVISEFAETIAEINNVMKKANPALVFLPQVFYGSVADLTARKPTREPRNRWEVDADGSDPDYAPTNSFVQKAYGVFSRYELFDAGVDEKKTAETMIQEAKEQRLLKHMYCFTTTGDSLEKLITEYIYEATEVDGTSSFRLRMESKKTAPEETVRRLRGMMLAGVISTLEELMVKGMVVSDKPDSYRLTERGKDEALKVWPNEWMEERMWPQLR